jgi:uncharacterized protein (DUF433 family)
VKSSKNIRSGDDCLAGTRLTVNDVISITLNNELSDYAKSNITEEGIDACFLSFFTKWIDAQ